ncbi:MAG: ABC transporter substrate-binding protein, partial [Patescibacteria group bacterium]
GIDPKRIIDEKLEKKVSTAPLPRIFGVFFNQNEAAIFTKPEVREALDLVVDRESIIENALYGFGVPIDSPFPPDIVLPSDEYQIPLSERILQAQTLLEKKGWKKNTEGVYELTTKKGTGKNAKQEKQTLSFSLATSNATELKSTAEILKKNFEAVGAKVELNFFELGDLTLNVIRERKYQALLYGEVVGRDLDLYAFWHSSQRNDPGLNIAMYTNKKADDSLTQTRATSDRKLRSEKFQNFLAEIRKDHPAVFLYSPEFIYVPPVQVKNVSLESLSISSERFLHIRDWYIETEKIWKWFNS